MKRKILLFGLLFFATLLSYGQTVENVLTSTEGNKVIITYDLMAEVEGQRFTVEVRSSINSFSTVLKEVSGDVGPDQAPGLVKIITWEALKEQGNFSGSVSFEVSAVMTFDPIRISYPISNSKAKPGKSMDIEWQGGDKDRSLRMAILQGYTSIQEIPDIGSSGTYTWDIPKTLSKGEHYQLKLFDPERPEQSAMSAEFQIKKTSILVFIIPGAIIAGAAAYLIFNDNGGTTPVNNQLPPPPEPPGG